MRKEKDIESDVAGLAGQLKDEINGLLHRKRFIHYSESFAFARHLEEIRASIEEVLLPADPAAAFALVDRVVKGDGKIINALDDSAGAVGEVLNDFAVLWLRAAARLPVPKGGWVDEVMKIAEGDEYGCRELFLKNAHILLGRDELYEMAALFKQKALRLWQKGKEERFEIKHLSAVIDMKQTAMALEDPALYEEAARLLGPELNSGQILDVANCYRKFGKADRALELLKGVEEEPYKRLEVLNLIKEILSEKGDREGAGRAAEILYRLHPSSSHLRGYLQCVGENEQGAIVENAVKEARSDGDFPRGLRLLLDFKRYDEAEAAVIERRGELVAIARYAYDLLLEFIKIFEKEGRVAPCVCLYRSLLMDILNESRYKAYAYAARYLKKLAAIDARFNDYPAGLETHEEFMESLKELHGKKRSFWEKAGIG